MDMISKKILVCSLISVLLCSCGGGGSGDGMLIEGTLVEGRGVSHSAARHAAGESIENVSVCALGDCSITDPDGRWGIIAPEDFPGGEVLISVNGHSIDASLTIDVPHGARHVNAALLRVDEGVALASLTVDGASEDDDHHHEQGEGHEAH